LGHHRLLGLVKAMMLRRARLKARACGAVQLTSAINFANAYSALNSLSGWLKATIQGCLLLPDLLHSARLLGNIVKLCNPRMPLKCVGCFQDALKSGCIKIPTRLFRNLFLSKIMIFRVLGLR
jgi:hypothetical protein